MFDTSISYLCAIENYYLNSYAENKQLGSISILLLKMTMLELQIMMKYIKYIDRASSVVCNISESKCQLRQ